MSKEAMKLALEALEEIESYYGYDRSVGAMASSMYEASNLAKITSTRIREALAEQETVLPGGGHVPAVPVAVYGYCPECGGAGVMRERRPNGDDKCTNGHKYPSSKALAEQKSGIKQVIELYDSPDQPAQQEPVAWMQEMPPQEGETRSVRMTTLKEHATLQWGNPIPLYTTPPAQRTWVGLTEPERLACYDLNPARFASAIEAKLKEKNA